MTSVKVRLNLRALNALMKSAPVQAEVTRRAQRIADAAGEGFEAIARPARYTARAYVHTKDAVGRKRQAESSVLERSLDAGR
jgi:hypothetical protein